MADATNCDDVTQEDGLRANVYALLARLLARPPDAVTLRRIAALEGDGSEFGEAVRALARAAKAATVDTVQSEYFDLFIGLGSSEVKPYASAYLGGGVGESLARLRGDMSRFGIEISDGVGETEDHIAALCEMMAGLITGGFGQPATLAEQRAFFDDHLGHWATRFFGDLQAARRASFYMPVGAIGELFIAVETHAFELAA